MRRPSWAAVRALLITAVLLSQTLEAMPMPTLRESHLRRGVGQQELARWHGLLQRAGLDVTEDELADFGLSLGERASTLKRRLREPADPLRQLLGFEQDWGMFAIVTPFPGRLLIERREADGAWQPVFRAPGEGEGALARKLRYRRMRAVYDSAGDRPHPGKLYDRFSAWAAAEVFDAHPDTEAVRVQLLRMTVRLPWEVPSPEEPPENERLVTRADLAGGT
ncbi:MAG: hypothetical protein ACI8S6_005570 [Myxococcota bacterium]|jgi:hypothetical protein